MARGAPLSVALLWDSTALSEVGSVLQRVELQMDVQRAFKGVTQPLSATLRGMMCINGHRHCGFFFDAVQRIWQWFDDSTLAPVGEDWAAVINKCSLARYQPLFLFYAVQSSSV